MRILGIRNRDLDPNIKHKTTTTTLPQAIAQQLSPDQETLHPLEPHDDTYYQYHKYYRFCNARGCGLKSVADDQDKRPHASLAVFLIVIGLGPHRARIANPFVPEEIRNMDVSRPGAQDHAFARVLVNPQYVFEGLTDSLSNLLDARTLGKMFNGGTQQFCQGCPTTLLL